MRKILVFLMFTAATAAVGTAQAQIKCWNENGRRVCGDAPPAGARVTTLKAPSGSTDAVPDPAAKDAKKGPMTPAEREQDYRKRQLEAQKAADKSALAQKDAEAKKENCERAKEALRSYESGRVARTDAKGERYFLDDAQLASETAKARQIAQESCN
jgi:hypothetical protein